MYKMQTRKVRRPVLHKKELSVDKRENKPLLQTMYPETKSGMVLQQGGKVEKVRSHKEEETRKPSIFQREEAKIALDRQNESNKCLRGKMRVLSGKRTKVFSYRPLESRWEFSPQGNRKQDHLCLVTSKQLSSWIQDFMSQLQYGYSILENLSSQRI